MDLFNEIIEYLKENNYKYKYKHSVFKNPMIIVKPLFGNKKNYVEIELLRTKRFIIRCIYGREQRKSIKTTQQEIITRMNEFIKEKTY